MESITRRPAALFCIVFVGMGFAGIHLSSPVRWLAASLCAVLLILFFFIRPAGLSAVLRRTLCIALCGILLGSTFFSVYTDLIIRRDIRRFDGCEAEITGVVEQCEYATSYMAEYRVRLRSADGESIRFTVLLETPDTSLSAGDGILCRAVFTPFEEMNAGFTEERYYFSEGIRMRAEAEKVTVTDTVPTGIRTLFDNIRLSMRARLRVSLGRDAAALPAALFLGDRSQLSDSLSRDFRRLGISHLLAISGLHFMLILGGTEKILLAFIPAKRTRLLILAGVTVFYMLLSGMTESVCRAGLMMLFSYSAVLFSRQGDMPTALGVSAFLICIANPAAYYSVGLQLSVIAVGALACCSHLKKRLPSAKIKSRVLRFLAESGYSLLTTTAVQLVILPLLCLYFGEMSLLTPAATLLFSPLVQLILFLTPVLLFIPSLTPLILLMQHLTAWTEQLASSAASLRGITVPLNYALCPLFALLITISFICLTFSKGRRCTAAALSAFCLLTAGFGGYLAASLSADAAQTALISSVYKKNDAVTVVSEGKYLLCDMSDGSYSAMRAAYETARLHHATELEAILLTHLHARHIHTFDRISNTTYVRALILPEAENENETAFAASLIACANEKGIPVYQYSTSAGSTVQFADVHLQMTRSYISRSSHPILSLSVKANEKTVQYLGTSFSETETIDPSADTLIFGIHGPIYKKTYTLPQGAAIREICFRGESAVYLHGMLPADTRVQEEDILYISLSP